MVKKRTNKGLLLYDMDDDELAFQVGQKLENDPPENIFVEKYQGPRDLGRSKLPKGIYYQMTSYERKEIEEEELDYYRKIMHPILKKTIQKYQPKFYLELHSSPEKLDTHYKTWFKTQYIWLETYPDPANKGLRAILEKYPEHQKKIVEDKKIPVWKVHASRADVWQLPTYYGLIVEIVHRDDEPVPQDFIEVGEILIRNLCDFLLTKY